MAHIKTELPTQYKGEREVAIQLQGLEDDDLYLWFGLNCIPGVRDIDILAVHRKIGMFTIEVKAVPLNMIKQFGFDFCEIEGRKTDRGPVKQAHDAYVSLREYLGPFMRDIPYIVPTACWSKINRREWNQHWDDENVIGDFANRLLFREDIFGDPRAFTERLEVIYKKPPLGGAAARQQPQVSLSTIEKLSNRLNPRARPKPTFSDYQRLKALEKEITSDAVKRVPPWEGKQLLYTGHPGTGKTFRLLQIGLYHAAQDCRVMFVCFNKVLATDIRRLLNFSDIEKLAKYPIKVVDIFQLASSYAEGEQLGYVEGYSHAEWGEMVLELIQDSKTEEELSTYDTILVDEAQDMQSWQLEFAKTLLEKEEGTFCAALGRGQELYGGSDKESLKNMKESQLQRNFRNTRPGFMFARCFYEAYPEYRKIDSALERFDSKENQIEMLRGSGNHPSKKLLNEADLPGDDDPHYQALQAERMTEESLRIIQEEYDSFGDNDMPFDLMLLVPNPKGAWASWVKEALQKFEEKNEIGFIDYLDTENRRKIPPADKIRLVSFHSCRGLEANKVIVFGFEWLPKLVENLKRDNPEQVLTDRKLGYIVLSRALFDTTLVMRGGITNRVSKFIDEALYSLQKKA